MKISAQNTINGPALLTQQNPDPLFCISIHGYILTCNPAAEVLDYLVFQGKQFTTESFWAYFAKKGDYIFDHFTFEVTANGKTYSFLCRYLPDQNYFNAYGRDVTLEKNAKRELARLSLVASANKNGVLFNDEAGKILWANESFCLLTGYSLNEVIGKNTLDFCRGPLADKKTLAYIANAIGVSDNFNHESLHYRKNGSWFWARVSGQSYTNSNDCLEYFAVVEDITREKDREDQLKVLSQIAENNINAVIITDEKGCITWVNNSFTKTTGYTAAEVQGKKPGHLLQGEDTDKKTAAYLKQQIAAAQPFNAEILNYNKAHKPYWLRIQGQPITNNNGDLIGFFAVEEDVTHEKEILTRIKESEERFKLALEKMGDNVWEHNFETGKTLFYKSTGNILGNEEPNLDDGLRWWFSIHPDDLELVRESDRLYKSGAQKSHNLKYRVLHSDGTIKWILDKGVVIGQDKNGLPRKTIGTHTDITLIKQTEVELEQRAKQFKSLSENVPGVIYEYEFRADGTEGLRYISPAIERVFGIAATDFVNYTNYLNAEDRERIKKKNLHSNLTLEPFYDEAKLFVPGQKVKWHAVHSSFSYISQTGDKVFTGFMKDITEQKTAEDSLRANEEKYRNIIANMNLGLLEVDTNGCVTYANQGFCDMSGYDMQEMIGQNAGTLFVAPENDLLLEEKKKKREQGMSDAYELEVHDKAGNKRWWFISGAPRYNDKQELVGSTGIHLDITRQKAQEAELVTARIKAEELARAKDSFLANMSHEIRTPMNAIMGMSNQLAKTGLSAQQQFYLNTILSASESLLVIINDILDLSKIEAGKLSMEDIGFELGKLITQVKQVITHKAEEKGLDLNIATLDPCISPVLVGDPYRISQVLINLLTNAVKFTDNGSVSLNCSLLADAEHTQTIEICVTDTGIGMDEAFIEKLFEKFTQEYESVTRQYGGTGLGMSICKELVELMNGSIKVTSRKGCGTKVSVTLQLKKGADTDLPKRTKTQFRANFLAGKKVLVTDDNELNRLVAGIILQNYGSIVLNAKNGVEALQIIKAENPDIILMDVQMPVLNGFEATRKLREQGLNTPVIALTAAAIKGERDKCIAAGMNDYITKPFAEAEFLKTISNWLTIPPQEMEQPMYSLEKLREISRGNDAFVKRMVDIFCSQTPTLVADMAAAWHNNELGHMASIAHQLKPSVDNLNIDKLKQVIKAIEDIGKERTPNKGLAGLLAEAQAITDKVVTLMRNEYPENQ